MRWALLAVAALVVLAGCSSLFAAGEERRGESGGLDGTLTPAPVPEVTVTPTPERWPVAPGLSRTGVADVEVLVAAHRAALANRSYTVTQWRGSASPPNETVELFRVSEAAVESSRRYVAWTSRTRVRIGNGLTNVADYREFVTGQVRRLRYLVDGHVDPIYVRRHAVDARFNPYVGDPAVAAIRRHLPVANATVARTRVDGRRYFEVVGGRDDSRTENRRDYTVRALVSPAGFVRSLNVTYVETGVYPLRVRYRLAYTGVGETTVDPPAWTAAWNRSQPFGPDSIRAVDGPRTVGGPRAVDGP